MLAARARTAMTAGADVIRMKLRAQKAVRAMTVAAVPAVLGAFHQHPLHTAIFELDLVARLHLAKTVD